MQSSFVYILLSTAIVLFLLAATIFMIGVRVSNSLILKNNRVNKSFSNVDVLLKKRCDLISNLVAVIKNQMELERQTLAEITMLRSRAMSGDLNPQQRLNTENQITRTMANIMASIENYPELKSDRYLTQLLKLINETELQILTARLSYNTAVTDYNNAIEMFPSNIVASYIKYAAKELFVTPAEERANINTEELFS